MYLIDGYFFSLFFIFIESDMLNTVQISVFQGQSFHDVKLFYRQAYIWYINL